MATACMHQIPSRSRQDATLAKKKGGGGVAFCVKLGEINHTQSTSRLIACPLCDSVYESVSRLAAITIAAVAAVVAYQHRRCDRYFNRGPCVPVGDAAETKLYSDCLFMPRPVEDVQRVSARPLFWASSTFLYAWPHSPSMPQGKGAEACRPACFYSLISDGRWLSAQHTRSLIPLAQDSPCARPPPCGRGL
ncbi:hypothetical protein LY76DRAFT_32856 [Colletotrichum caudatum]|nr:hypothetical protein LY76DRAFT_32856 [Colletotrichum caudatum]